MTKRDFLLSLSKDELVELIFGFSETNQEACDFIQKKIYQAEVLGQNNKQENLLENPKAMNAEVPVAEISAYTNAINRFSSPEEKITLFKSLFLGRTDVFALRWHNEKSNKSGYSPVCKNKWLSGKCDLKKYSCAACPFKFPESLSDSRIYNHLAGKDLYCRDVIGIYPLLLDNCCNFLAFDFDSHKKNFENTEKSDDAANDNSNSEKWKNDVRAVCKTCGEYSIFHSVEISRSGNGAHLWIFFSEKIKAKTARQFGSLILQASMLKNHSISLESFDRMFPNQDEIPNGGYGNLIALPLQGRAVKEKHSVFTDEYFLPYDDQWKYLSSVQKLSEKEIIEISEQIQKKLGFSIPLYKEENPFENKKTLSNSLKSKDTENKELGSSDFPQKVKITLTNRIEIQKAGISEKALYILRRTAVFLNPEYYKNLRLHLPLYNIPRFIDCSKENAECLLLPRGLLDETLETLKSANAGYEIADKRESGTKIDLAFKAELYDEQKVALTEMLKNDTGILSAGTGFGKTVTAAALIARRKTNTLILVQTHALLEQWKKSVKAFLDFAPGTIASGKDKSTGIVDIAIVKSLTEKNSDRIKPRTHKYGMVIIDECHHVSAFSTENLASSFCAKYVYGLTATPIRRDGHQKIIFYQCGKILFSTSSKQMNKMQNFDHYFIPRFSNFHFKPDSNTTDKNRSINSYYAELVKNEARNELIAEDVKNAVKNGRTPLVLSDRIEHLETLEKHLKNSAKNVILITGRGTSKQKKTQLEKLNSIPKEESLIVLATGKYAGEGFDQPRLDTLMLVFPFSWKGTLAQYCGRLHRNFAGKNEVQIYDYVDFRIPVFDRMYQNRLKGYRQLGYSVKVDDEKSTGQQQNARSKIYSFAEYKTDFEDDLACAKKSVTLFLPYLTKTQTQNFIHLVLKNIPDGARVLVFTRRAATAETRKKQDAMILQLENAGAKVEKRNELSQKTAIIDEKILWYGSVNFLSAPNFHTPSPQKNEECTIRIFSAAVAQEIEAEMVGKEEES